MPTSSGWLGASDTGGAYIPTNNQWHGNLAGPLLYAGTQKNVDWLGQLDQYGPYIFGTSGAFIPHSLIYVKDMGASAGGLQPITTSPNSGYLGFAWQRSIFIIALPFPAVVIISGTIPGTQQIISF